MRSCVPHNSHPLRTVYPSNMCTKEVLMKAMETQIGLSRRALDTDIRTASVHYENVKTLCSALKLLGTFESMLISECDDID